MTAQESQFGQPWIWDYHPGKDLNLERQKLFFLGQLAVSYAGLADFFSDVSYQAEDAWLEEISKSSEERWHKDQCREYLLPDVPGKAH